MSPGNVLKNKTLASDVDGERQNETGYELSGVAFVVTDFTWHNMMDGSVWAGNDLEMTQIRGTMRAEEESRRLPYLSLYPFLILKKARERNSERR